MLQTARAAMRIRLVRPGVGALARRASIREVRDASWPEQFRNSRRACCGRQNADLSGKQQDGPEMDERGAITANGRGTAGGLWAITSYFNPMGYRRRLENYRIFREHLQVPLLTVELGYGRALDLNHGDADILELDGHEFCFLRCKSKDDVALPTYGSGWIRSYASNVFRAQDIGGV